MRAVAQAVRGDLSSRGSARVFKGVFASVKISPRCQKVIYTRWHTRQALAVTPTVHQRRHEPKPPFDHTCSTAPQPCDCSTTSHTFHCINIYCSFTHFASTINYGYWDFNNLQAAGFIFLAKLRVSNSNHQLLHLDMCFFSFFFNRLCLCNACSLCILCTIAVRTHTLTSARCRTGRCKGQSSLTCRWWQGLTGSRSCCHNSFYHSIDCGKVKGDAKVCWDRGNHKSITGKKRRIFKGVRLDLDFCWVYAGKTRDQVLQ